jgi:hypothetical protein
MVTTLPDRRHLITILQDAIRVAARIQKSGRRYTADLGKDYAHADVFLSVLERLDSATG